MAVKYGLYPCSNNLENKKNDKAYYPRVISNNNAEWKEVRNIIANSSTFKGPTMTGALEALSCALIELLKDGNRVHLPGIGYFSLTATCKKPITKMNARNIKIELKDIIFRPDTKMLRAMSNTTFECNMLNSHQNIYSDSEWEELLTKYFKENQFLSLKTLISLTSASNSTCWRKLHKWLNEGKLIKVESLSNKLYEPANGCFGKSKK